jgi:hypothetical protein
MTHMRTLFRVMPALAVAAGVALTVQSGVMAATTKTTIVNVKPVKTTTATKTTTAMKTTTAAKRTKPSTTAAPSGAVDPNAPEVKAAGDIPDDIAFVPYTSSTGGYSITTPEGWSRRTIPDGVVFTDKYNIIQAESFTGQTAPTTGSASAAVKAQLGKAKGFVFGKASTVKRKGGSAILVTYVVSSAPNEVTGKTLPVAVERYEFHKAGTSVVLTLSGAQGADNVDPWKIVTDSFAWV